MNIMKLNGLVKVLYSLILLVTFYFGILEGVIGSYIKTGSFANDHPFISGAFTGFFILFLLQANKIYNKTDY